MFLLFLLEIRPTVFNSCQIVLQVGPADVARTHASPMWTGPKDELCIGASSNLLQTLKETLQVLQQDLWLENKIQPDPTIADSS